MGEKHRLAKKSKTTPQSTFFASQRLSPISDNNFKEKNIFEIAKTMI